MARKASAFSLTNMIAKRREDLAAARDGLKALKENAPAFRAATHVANMVANHASEIGFTRWAHVTPYASFGNLELMVNLEGYVDSLKEGAVIEILEQAMACGFEVTGSRDYLSEYASQRSFRFRQIIAGVKVDLTVVANIKEASESCRKVKVGTKLEEVAQYELVCA